MSDSIQVAGAILRRRQVEQLVGLSRSTIYQRMRDGTFPRAISLGGRMVGWRVSEIELFLADPAGYRVSSTTASEGNGDD
ncbi:prophage CP4-57 regulatory family protein [Paraburkholderia xenovorans LB400]|jgi:prophage regulatory protein|uniref:Phage transcriptional regulator, AlpA n=1 Tax=Paraburkholderia xenovorans (strain LB400) TaxID=266265 RepID=Q13XI3_PARXL|nr:MULTISPECIES: AlpA family transcriptional regulator [Paraburkholderia]ABE31206.1 phage transcriptional regulator, AlpA [Paraburkholderia xenovorans LB400]AIP32716.1 prophage CP4-57 regulatory family protein [Paraburkholderia xenovorans LB400]CAG9262415.1 Phage transcriptional regulator, AlpA [Paraburkholderia unamae]